MIFKARRSAHEIVRWILVGELFLGTLNSSAEASDLLDGWADYASILFTIIIHGIAIWALIARWEHSKWIALTVFISDFFLGIWIGIAITEASTNAHALTAWHSALIAGLFAIAAWAWSGDEDKDEHGG